MRKKTKDLEEAVQYQDGQKLRVDREAGVIHDVLVCGPRSRNKAAYPRKTRDKVVQLIEGIRVNFNHHEQDGAKPARRSFQSWFGKLQNVRSVEDGLRADLKGIKSDPYYAKLMEAAENFPECFGLSPVWTGRMGEVDANGDEVVDEIIRAKCVDIVCEPATTASLYNEAEPDAAEVDAEPAKKMAVHEHAWEACKVAIGAILEEDGDPDEIMDKIKELIKHHKKIAPKPEKDDEEGGDESPEGSKDEPEEDEDSKTKEEELKELRLEKECRLLCEEMQIEAEPEILKTLQDLPNKKRRQEHLTFLKRKSLVRKPKTGTVPTLEEKIPSTKIDWSKVRHEN
jgi:hypothetical protein